jgi:hypothetical protein
METELTMMTTTPCATCGRALTPFEVEAPTSDGKARCDPCWMKTDYPGVKEDLEARAIATLPELGR